MEIFLNPKEHYYQDYQKGCIILCPIITNGKRCNIQGNHFKPVNDFTNNQSPNTNHYELHIPMKCECDHFWTLIIEFHKGTTSMTYQQTEADLKRQLDLSAYNREYGLS